MRDLGERVDCVVVPCRHLVPSLDGEHSTVGPYANVDITEVPPGEGRRAHPGQFDLPKIRP